MSRNLVCNECGGEMRRGFIVDLSGQFSQHLNPSYWIEGEPEMGFLGLKTEGKRQYYILAYCCDKCGFLKFYAGLDPSVDEQK